ncbi:MAG: EcsC family protein [Castellaniella sp.]|uniref:EcsC family protein n=1 Tax=Castellaniella sp. TaxID=1955812 RepID=UPI003C79177A
MKRLKIPTTEEMQTALQDLVSWYSHSNIQDIEEYVVKLRSQNPGITDDDLAKKIVNRKAWKCGLIGAATGIPGGLALPVTIPANIVGCWRVQIITAVAIAKVYGHTAESTDLKTDIFLILAGEAAKESLKRAGIEVGKSVTKKAVDKFVTREVMKKIWKIIPQKIITKAGEKSLFSFMKMVPLVGAPIGFAFDWPAALFVGNTAIKYYSGRG